MKEKSQIKSSKRDINTSENVDMKTIYWWYFIEERKVRLRSNK